MKLATVPVAALSVLSLAVAPDAAEAQLGELFRAVANGGSWTRLVVEEGRGRFRSAVLPVAGLSLEGCFQVWDGHSGTWRVRAEDLLGDAEIDVEVQPGEGVPFQYKAGLRAQIEITVEWSEPRDTTFVAWVGLKGLGGDPERDICEPPPEPTSADQPFAASLWSRVSVSSSWVPHSTAAPAVMITDG